jgi:hypothetical protein
MVTLISCPEAYPVNGMDAFRYKALVLHPKHPNAEIVS